MKISPYQKSKDHSITLTKRDNSEGEVQRVAILSPKEALNKRVFEELDPKFDAIKDPIARGRYIEFRDEAYTPYSNQSTYDFYDFLLNTQLALQDDPKFKDMSYTPSEVDYMTHHFGWANETPTRDVVQSIRNPVTKEALLRTAEYVREHGDPEMRDTWVSLVRTIASDQDDPMMLEHIKSLEEESKGDQSLRRKIKDYKLQKSHDDHVIDWYAQRDPLETDWMFINDPRLRAKYDPRKNNFNRMSRKEKLALIKEANDVATGFKAQYKDYEGYDMVKAPLDHTTKWMYENNPRAYLDRYDMVLPDDEVLKLQARVRDSFDELI